MNSFPLFVRVAGRPVILIGDGAAAEAKRRLIERGGGIVADEAAEARLAIVALEDGARAEAAVARLRARGILVNAVDRPDLCDFTLPAIVERGPVLVAVGTGGVSAGLAAALRQRLEALLPAGLGEVAEALGQARGALRRRFPESGARRRALGALLAEGGALDPLVEHADAAGVLASSLISLSGEGPSRASRVPITDHGLRPGGDEIARVLLASPDPEDLTLRAARLLGQADRVYLVGDPPRAIIARARADAERIDGRAPALPLPGLSVELCFVP